ncbi:venom peptide SjAPI-like [Dermatophagoides pteronyssinus]|uniref:Venom peptide SjAPI-like n=2 Tax=Dermatophagoides pteronyssinus TaxID=6956 RepID=A0A6P6YML7_DERPT|nr:venom peptide SjAPI-like [Dermatophagoides pteronyssinus]KAH9420911.1 hypothetical protein DERP_001345 [Dermatophagoides pteronyssinus]
MSGNTANSNSLITTLICISIYLILFISLNKSIASAIPIVDECPEHSTFNPCMTRCPVTCSNFHSGPPECLSICQVGCECQPGFIKVTKNPWGPCVKQYECQLYTLNSYNNKQQQQKRNRLPIHNPRRKISQMNRLQQLNRTQANM